MTANDEQARASPRKKVVGDLDRCIGAGVCIGLAPDTFDLGPEGQVVVLQPQVDAASLDRVQEAIRRCPMNALRLVQDE